VDYVAAAGSLAQDIVGGGNVEQGQLMDRGHGQKLLSGDVGQGQDNVLSD
jgi:ribosomal protein L27